MFQIVNMPAILLPLTYAQSEQGFGSARRMRHFLGWKNVRQGLVSAVGVEALPAKTCREFIGLRTALAGGCVTARVPTEYRPDHAY